MSLGLHVDFLYVSIIYDVVEKIHMLWPSKTNNKFLNYVGLPHETEYYFVLLNTYCCAKNMDSLLHTVANKCLRKIIIFSIDTLPNVTFEFLPMFNEASLCLTHCAAVFFE